MRTLAVALLLVPRLAAAQAAPRSIAVETGWTLDPPAGSRGRVPVALAATWWIVGDLDVGARVAWAFAAEPEVRGADGVIEAGLGLRQGVARWSALRLLLVADVTGVRHLGDGGTTSAPGLRVAAGPALEAFVGRDLSLSVAAERGVLLGTASGGEGTSATVRAAAYF